MGVENIYNKLVKLNIEVDDLGAVDIKTVQQLKHTPIPKSMFKYRLG